MQEKTLKSQFPNIQSLIDENMALRKEIEALQNHLRFDPTTQTLSKAGFYEDYTKFARPGDVILFADLDDFKSVNDSYGHHVGDRLLFEVGQVLTEKVAPNGFVGRLAGDEFLILMPSSEAERDFAYSQSICSSVLTAKVMVEDVTISRSASVGFVIVEEEMDPEHIVINANSALRAAKLEGKNRARMFSTKILTENSRSPSIDEIRLGLKRNEIGYFVQPIFNLESLSCFGYEALLRWERKDGEILGPAHFLNLMTSAYNDETKPPLAAARLVAEWVAKKQCKCISFNISAAFLKQLTDKGTEWISEIIGEVPYEMVLFELVETIVDSGDDSMAMAVSELRDKGIRIALDDFGIGHSTLQRLQSVPVDYVKIDRHFLVAASISVRDEEILRGMVELIHASGAEAIIEGIEKQSQLDLAISLGASLGQGFFLGRPGPIAEWDVSDPERPILTKRAAE